MLCRNCPLVTEKVTIVDIVQRTREFFDEQLHLIADTHPEVLTQLGEALGVEADRACTAAYFLDCLEKDS